MPQDGVHLVEAAAALGAVLLLILLLGRAARLLPATGQQGQGLIRLHATLALDARRRLHLVEAGGRQALILTGGAQDLLIPWRLDRGTCEACAHGPETP